MSKEQTVTGALARTSVMAKAEKEKAAKAKDKPELTFHQKQAAAKAEDPDNEALQSALIEGESKAAGFLQTVRSPDHPDHEQNLRIFKNRHDSDPRKTVQDFQQRACEERGAAPYEARSLAYEQNVTRPYKPSGDTNSMQIDFFNNMCKELKEKWDKVGYKGDKAFISNYAAKYGLTRDDSTMAMRNIQPRP